MHILYVLTTLCMLQYSMLFVFFSKPSLLWAFTVSEEQVSSVPLTFVFLVAGPSSFDSSILLGTIIFLAQVHLSVDPES